jgi:hypothetical protein
MAGRVYLMHLFPPLGEPGGQQARHYTGSAKESRLKARFVDHALGRGANMLRVQLERGGKWVVAKTEPGSTTREYQLKAQGGATRRCPVCIAERDLAAGKLTKEEALAKAGWETATGYDRSVLLEIFGMDAEPETVPHYEPPVQVKAAAAEADITPEINALVDDLIAGWSPEAAEGQPQVQEYEMEAG